MYHSGPWNFFQVPGSSKKRIGNLTQPTNGKIRKTAKGGHKNWYTSTNVWLDAGSCTAMVYHQEVQWANTSTVVCELHTPRIKKKRQRFGVGGGWVVFCVVKDSSQCFLVVFFSIVFSSMFSVLFIFCVTFFCHHQTKRIYQYINIYIYQNGRCRFFAERRAPPCAAGRGCTDNIRQSKPISRHVRTVVQNHLGGWLYIWLVWCWFQVAGVFSVVK